MKQILKTKGRVESREVMMGLLVLNGCRAAMKKVDQLLHPRQSFLKMGNRQEGRASLCLQITHCASLSRMLTSWLSC